MIIATASAQQIWERVSERLENAGVPNAQGEARQLLAALLRCRPLEVFFKEQTLSESQKKQLENLVDQRCRRIPLAYLLGEMSFGDVRLKVNEHVLIPRLETEELLHIVLNALAEQASRSFLSVLDVGTGSGCLAISLAAALKTAAVYAVDVSSDALSLARENALLNGVEKKVTFVRSDLLEAFSHKNGFSAVVANLPYISGDDLPGLDPEVLREPVLALDGGPDGLSLIRRLIPQALGVLQHGGKMFLEVGYNQSERVARDMETAGFISVETRRDMAGIGRFVLGMKP